MRLLPLLSAAWLTTGAAMPDYAGALAHMAAHKAVYKLTFANSPNGSVLAATGTMDYQVIDACDGWATEQRLLMDVTGNSGQTVRMISDYSTWEAKDGSKLRFRVHQTNNGQLTMQLAGEATEGANGAGVIHYTDPKPTPVTMAPGTLFPMAHTAHIVALAESGKKFITLPLFDGSSDSGTENTFIVVTGASKPMPVKYPSLSALPSEQVNVSFFDHDSDGQQPDYAVAMRYWQNGVADDLRMNFGDFTMNGALTGFTPGAHGC